MSTSIGNARYMPRHRAVVTCIHDGDDTIPKIIKATGFDDKRVRTSIAYVRHLGLVETLPEKVNHKARYRLIVPLQAAIGALPIELVPPTFNELEIAFGIPPEIVSTIALQAEPRLVEGVGIRRP